MEKINKVYLSLGSNIDDRVFHLKEALLKIEDNIGRIHKKSSVYETEPVGFVTQSQFYNICIEVHTHLSPNSLLKETQEIEREIGRKSKTTDHYESRKIDIDIIFYTSFIIHTKNLSIPHKNYTDRKFVLIPLCEIDESIIDPILKNSIREILLNCPDNSVVKRTALAI